MNIDGSMRFAAPALAACCIALTGCASVDGAPAQPGLSTTLAGANVLPGPADPDGSGTARISFVEGAQNVCYDLAVRDIAPATLAHIHSGLASEVGGPPVVMLGTPTNGAAKGCVSAPQAAVDKIRANPAGYFVNIHNAEFPGGAIRGQLGG